MSCKVGLRLGISDYAGAEVDGLYDLCQASCKQCPGHCPLLCTIMASRQVREHMVAQAGHACARDHSSNSTASSTL